MKFTAISAAIVGSAVAAPFSFPLSNGFPNPSTEAVTLIQVQAGGTLPNTALPKNVSADVITALELIAANELFEVAYFTELYNNITNNVKGYETEGLGYGKAYVESAVFRIRAQEELHALGANAILKSVGASAVPPCKYSFPVSDIKSAFALAQTFTDIVLGVLPAVQLLSGTKGGPDGSALIPLIGAILGQEAEQVGWFRATQGKFPSAAPFLVATTPQFALSAIKQFLVPGSCPAAYTALEAQVPSFPPLSVVIDPVHSSASYSITGLIDTSKHALTYLSGQNTPVTVAITNVVSKNGKTSFKASFPYSIKASSGFAGGLIVAAVTNKGTSFSSASDVAANTVYGPGLIEFL